MTDLDRLVTAAVAAPDDGGCRGALADELRAWGDPLLAHAVEDAATGPGLLQRAAETGKQCGLPASANLLWCEFHVLPRMMPRLGEQDVERIAEQLLNTPLDTRITTATELIPTPGRHTWRTAHLFCDHCAHTTRHYCRDSGHERDSSGDIRECTVCGWRWSGMIGEYSPP